MFFKINFSPLQDVELFNWESDEEIKDLIPKKPVLGKQLNQ